MSSSRSMDKGLGGGVGLLVAGGSLVLFSLQTADTGVKPSERRNEDQFGA